MNNLAEIHVPLSKSIQKPRFLFSDHDIDDLEMQVVRYKPEGLDILCRNTKFTKKELQIMYRGFKQVGPVVIPFVIVKSF